MREPRLSPGLSRPTSLLVLVDHPPSCHPISGTKMKDNLDVSITDILRPKLPDGSSEEGLSFPLL
jgi:hypothetical protein